MLDIPSISAVVAAVGVLVAALYAILELRNLVKTRQTDLVIRLYSTLTNREWLEAWDRVRDSEYRGHDEYKKQYGLVDLNAVNAYFELIGVLLRKKLIDIGLVTELFTWTAKRLWEKIKQFAEELRKEYNDQSLYSNIEYLYNETQQRAQTLQAQQ